MDRFSTDTLLRCAIILLYLNPGLQRANACCGVNHGELNYRIAGGQFNAHVALEAC
jgi:hypothetical protein